MLDLCNDNTMVKINMNRSFIKLLKSSQKAVTFTIMGVVGSYTGRSRKI